MKIFLSIYFGLLISYFSYSQHYPHDHMQYDFIDEKHNELVIFNKKKWSTFLSKIDNQWHYGGEEINIIQFGGSHIQADVWSNRLRDHFQHIVPYNGAARGLYFPFKLIKSNTSPYLKTTHNGEWKGFRNSVSYHHSPFGLLGARAELIDSTSLITFYVNKEHCVNCYFDQIDFLVHDSLNNHCIDILTDSIISIELDTDRQSFILSNLVDSVAILIERENHKKGKFSLFGLNFSSQLKGITYHSVGVNGASVPSYLRCEYFMDQIDLVNPDLIIFSIGINDAYEPSFLAETYFKNYDTLINLIKDQYPDVNFLFTTNESCKAKFKESLKKFSGNLRRKGIPKESVDKFLGSLFDGINNQIFNTPIDLFIEDIIYTRFTKMRPIQYLSLLRLTNEGLVATTRKDIVDNVPKSVLTSSKIYNLVNAFHFRTLFNINLVDEFKATKLELNTAKSLYQEFNEYRNDKKGGEEYEIIQHWAEDLKLDSYFNLIPEEERKRKTVDEVVDEINDDPYGLNDQDPSKDRKMKKFLDEHSGDDINNAVVMFMIDALNYFKNFQKEEVKKIAFELATIGMTGIDPKKNGYSVPSIPNSSFSGYKTLSYYYVSWALAIPEMLNSLNMPFDEEYDLANKMINL